MFLNFPVINNLNEVLPYIKDNPNFGVYTKSSEYGDYTVIDYHLNTPEMFQNSYQKECRGIIFDAEGKIMSRPLHKFFNLNEREESRIENLDFSKKHWILEKLDGSMIRSILFRNEEVSWGSKAGITFLTPQIEEFVKKNPQYLNFINFLKVFYNLTAIFEWCSRQNRIVLDYPEDRLVLLAMRYNTTGEYFNYEKLSEIAKKYQIDYVKQYEGTVENMEKLVDSVKEMKGIEGFVIRFEDGNMVKVKTDEYVFHHKAKDSINLEKNVISVLINGEADDFKSLLQKDDRKRLEAFEKDFYFSIEMYVTRICYSHSACRRSSMTRKQYALHLSKELLHTPLYKSIIFTFFDQEHISYKIIREEIIRRIKNKCGSQTTIHEVRELFGGIRWDNYLSSTLTI